MHTTSRDVLTQPLEGYTQIPCEYRNHRICVGFNEALRGSPADLAVVVTASQTKIQHELHEDGLGDWPELFCNHKNAKSFRQFASSLTCLSMTFTA